MNNSPESVTKAESITKAQFVGALAVAAGLAACWRLAPRQSAGSERHTSLVTYLRDHLSGSDMGVRVVADLTSTYPTEAGRKLFAQLTSEFEEERTVVRSLLSELGASGRSAKRAVSAMSATVLSLGTGGAPDDLSLFRTLEALAIGIQGKRGMWRLLRDLGIETRSMNSLSFDALEQQAVGQWELVEEQRHSLGLQTFR